MSTPDARLAVDIGGTFTDIVLETAASRRSVKVLTTKAAPEAGVLDGIGRVLALAGIPPDRIGLIVHGTTLATNAIIERSGAKTALVTTGGFRDVVEMAYEHRFDQYDVFLEKPKPLVERPWRYTVPERIDAKGAVRLALDETALHALAGQLRAEAIESIAIGFLHSYANPAHEQRAGAILSAALPGLAITLSSDVCPELREYERFTTACANAYVQPLIAGYLGRLEHRLRETGFRCPLLLMTSGGGLTTLATARRFPIRLVESGPAGGAILAADIARGLARTRVLSFDMGGTTAKICLIDDGTPLTSRSFEVDRQYLFLKGSGFPVRIPVIEMVEIGAGGGSIAGVDAMQRVTVGPASAGAQPGPACYAQGGTHATVTDANVALGRIDPDDFAGGSMRLDAARGAAAIAEHVARPLQLQPDHAAFAISEMVEENMANAARVHAVERGADLADRTLIAFGGSAPLHAARLAEKLGIAEVIIPAGAGVGSAIGFLRAPIAFQLVRTRLLRLGQFDADAVNAMLAAMAAEALAVVRLGAPTAEILQRRSVEMRYLGQGHDIAVALPDGPITDTAHLRAGFEAAYQALFGRIIPGLEIEITSWSLLAEAPAAAAPALPAAPLDLPPARPIGTRRLFDPIACVFMPAPLYRRADLAVGQAIAGPAVVIEDETTTVVTSRFTLTKTASGALHLFKNPAPAPGRLMDQAPAASLSRIRNQVMWNRLISVVEEQAQTLIRTAFGAATREAGDLSAGVYDTRGDMLAQAVTGTPGHINSMAKSVGHVLKKIPLAEMTDGDVFVFNDPWIGTGHLNDIVVVTPTFRRGQPIGLFACTLHVIDIGGRGTNAGQQIYEEGLFLPITKIVDAGKLNQWVVDIIAANVRENVQVVGDVYSEIACNEIGGRRLLAMMDEFSLETLDDLSEHILTHSRQASLDAIRKLPFGTYRNTMTVDGLDEPMVFRAALTIGADGIDVDFAGSPGTVAMGINVPLCYTEAYTSFGVKCIVAPDVPNNAASLATIRVTAPPGCILNAQHPAPVSGRGSFGQMLPDVVFGCLHQALPGGVPAEGTSCLWNLRFMGGPGRVNLPAEVMRRATSFNQTGFHSGGAGARPRQDGLSATAFPSGVRNVPVEVTESLAPLLVWRKEYRIDSGGAGTRRGGLGQVMEVESAEAMPFAINTNFDRCRFPPRGREGGLSGAAGRVSLHSGTQFAGRGHHTIPAGDRLRIEMPGGGGYGNPRQRARADVERDVAYGYISPAAAKDLYGL